MTSSLARALPIFLGLIRVNLLHPTQQLIATIGLGHRWPGRAGVVASLFWLARKRFGESISVWHY
jgi:hypothetical protein